MRPFSEIRIRKGISLPQIATATKICLRYLEAIESGHLEKLPGGVYAVNYLRQYARAIGCDDTELLESYLRVFPPEPEPSVPRRGSWLRSAYSYFSATEGSIRVARRAGT